MPRAHLLPGRLRRHALDGGALAEHGAGIFTLRPKHGGPSEPDRRELPYALIRTLLIPKQRASHLALPALRGLVDVRNGYLHLLSMLDWGKVDITVTPDQFALPRLAWGKDRRALDYVIVEDPE